MMGLSTALARACDFTMPLVSLRSRRHAPTVGMGRADGTLPGADDNLALLVDDMRGGWRTYRSPDAEAVSRLPRLWLWVSAILLAAAVVGMGFAAPHGGTRSTPSAADLLRVARAYLLSSRSPSYIATVSYDADLSLLRGVQIPWAAQQPCPSRLHSSICAHADGQLWFSQGHGRALTDGGTFVCGPSRTWGLNPMAGMATTTSASCTPLGPDMRGLGFTAGAVEDLLANLRQPVRISGQDLVAGRRCSEVLLGINGRACIDAGTGLLLRLDRLDRAGLPVAGFEIHAVNYHLALAQELFANPIPGGHGPLIDGLSQPLLNIQAADDQALFTSLVPTYVPPHLTALTPTFDTYYNSAHGYALEQRVRQVYEDGHGKIMLVIIETLPGSAWDATPSTPSLRVLRGGSTMRLWPSTDGAPSVVRIENLGTAALVSSSVLAPNLLELVALGLQ